MPPKKVEIKQYKDLTVEQAEQVYRAEHNDDPYDYVYAVKGRDVIMRASKDTATREDEKNG